MDGENAAVVQAYKFGATAEFDIFVPLTLSGKYAWNLTGLEADPEDAVSASEIKIAVGPIDVFETGLSVDASFAMVNGTLRRTLTRREVKFGEGRHSSSVLT